MESRSDRIENTAPATAGRSLAGSLQGIKKLLSGRLVAIGRIWDKPAPEFQSLASTSRQRVMPSFTTHSCVVLTALEKPRSPAKRGNSCDDCLR